ncbi:hypothetical protein GQ42DRAFT_5591 [Ramicandelaber brevisporus]|nr:hypothetical protein GQ42DRAFT_5591 [Ramicandelaber brevisporus]
MPMKAKTRSAKQQDPSPVQPLVEIEMGVQTSIDAILAHSYKQDRQYSDMVQLDSSVKVISSYLNRKDCPNRFDNALKWGASEALFLIILTCHHETLKDVFLHAWYGLRVLIKGTGTSVRSILIELEEHGTSAMQYAITEAKRVKVQLGFYKCKL